MEDAQDIFFGQFQKESIINFLYVYLVGRCQIKSLLVIQMYNSP